MVLPTKAFGFSYRLLMGVASVNFTPVPKVSSAAAHTAAEVANPNANTPYDSPHSRLPCLKSNDTHSVLHLRVR